MLNNRPLICVSIIKKKISEVIKTIKKLKKEKINCIELRLDYLDPFPMSDELSNLLKINIIKIATIRPIKEGGLWTGTEEDRINIINKIITEKIDYIDLEYSLKNVKNLIIKAHDNNVKVILSSHNFDNTPPKENLIKDLEKMASIGSDIIKIATTVKNLDDIISLLHLINYANARKLNIIIIGMGEIGKITRIVGYIFGSKIIYCSIPGEKAAPGQFDYKKLVEIIKDFE